MQRLNDNYSTLLDEEQKILKEEFNRFNGKVMDTAGDGFFVTFKTTQDAIECAVAIQNSSIGS